MSEMTERFGRAGTGDLIRLIIQELKTGADPITIMLELRAIAIYADFGTVMGVGEEARREFLCAQLERALTNIFAPSKPDPQGGHDA